MNWPEVWNGIVGGAVSGATVMLGLSRWLGDLWKKTIIEKVQQGNRKELEALKSEMQQSVDKANRMLDAGISKAILVTRTQFETEFAAYKEIFAALTELKHRIHAVRPMISVEPVLTREQQHEQLAHRLKELMKAHNEAISLADNMIPFYTKEIRQAIDLCVRASGHDIIEIRTGGDDTFSSTWYNEGLRRTEEFMGGYERVAELIQTRIASLGVLPT